MIIEGYRYGRQLVGRNNLTTYATNVIFPFFRFKFTCLFVFSEERPTHTHTQAGHALLDICRLAVYIK